MDAALQRYSCYIYPILEILRPHTRFGKCLTQISAELLYIKESDKEREREGRKATHLLSANRSNMPNFRKLIPFQFDVELMKPLLVQKQSLLIKTFVRKQQSRTIICISKDGKSLWCKYFRDCRKLFDVLLRIDVILFMGIQRLGMW